MSCEVKNTQCINMYRGTSKTFNLSVLKKDGTAQNITSATIRLTVKASNADATPVLMKDTISGGIVITNPTGGLAQITIEPSNTSALAPKQYVYDVWIQLSSGKRYVIIAPSKFVIDLAVGIIS